MEKWDLYNCKGEKTGLSHFRGEPIPEGYFHMVVELWVRNSDGEYLIQKRNKPLKNIHNPWSSTAGAAHFGESSVEAIQRESFEELGVSFNSDQLKLIERTFYDCFFMDTYEAEWDGDLETLTIDREEVEELRWVSKKRLVEMIKEGEFVSHQTTYIKDLME